MEEFYQEEYTPSEFDLRINSLIEEQVNSRVEDIKNELVQKNKSIHKLTKENTKLKEENIKLKNTSQQIEMFEVFKSLVDENNFSNFLSYFNLKSNKFIINGMDIESIPKWFEWLFHYYEDRDKLFLLMDLFDIKYPEWAKKYKMPYEYTIEELEIFIDKKYDRYICNGEIFNSNIGFFWKNVQLNKGDTYKILTNKQSFTDYIPWQLVLSNPLWSDDSLFNKVLNAIKQKQNNIHYFFAIQDYTQILEKQAMEMAKLLPKEHLYDIHKKFIENNKNIIKDNVWLAEKFKEKINDNQFSTFYYLNYPIEMQKKFIRSDKHSNYYKKLELIKKMDIPKKEKLEFLQEFAEKEF